MLVFWHLSIIWSAMIRRLHRS
ncbi:hypothetical protein DSM3645_03158 [Blastopirellula marina DSM 3645]|uniref:Uncharacterized protein n=1 Tax=Blastopirellula marina DSM 3645 TaxID=314230 RepID=A3ZVU5_9BACT|nr:hypothetical protein DSM3645_03158 [Blastopirellula marina DSM 3645]